MKLSVIIVNRNVCVLLRQALTTVVKACANIEHEIFVVDNASTDNSVSMVKKDFTQVHLIENHKNLGFSKANNQALQLAQGDYVLLLNPDTITKSDTLQKTIEFMESHSVAGGVSVRMINPMGEFLTESKRGLSLPWIAFFKLTGLSKMFSKSRFYDRSHASGAEEFETTEIDVLSAPFMLLRKSVLNRIGLLDERFFMYGENIDLSYRIRMAGFKNYYFPKTYIIHFKEQSAHKFSWKYIRHFYGAMFIFAGKYLFRMPRLHLKGIGVIFPPSYEVER